MAAAGGGSGRPDPEEEEPPPVQYHMSDDEEDKTFYARADLQRSPTSPGYSYRPTPTFPADADPASDDDMVEAADDDMVETADDDMVEAAEDYYSSSSDDEAWPDCEYEDDPPDPAGAQRQADEYAEHALRHYNADPRNDGGVKYELVEATNSKYIFVGYAHVNFVARPRGAGAGAGKERLFFAELHEQLGRDAMVPTCLWSLDSEDDRVVGLAGKPWEDYAGPDEARYCFACPDSLGTGLHSKPGTRMGLKSLRPTAMD